MHDDDTMPTIATPAMPATEAEPQAPELPRPAIDWNRLTLAEVDKLETLSGQPVSALGDDTKPKGRLMAAMVFVASRRYAEPKAWDECLAMTVDAATAYLGLEAAAEDSDGTEALEDDPAGN